MSRRLDELERRYNVQFKGVFDAIQQLMVPPEKTQRPIGFRVEEGRPTYGRRRHKGAKPDLITAVAVESRYLYRISLSTSTPVAIVISLRACIPEGFLV
jgi:hypothetical protein